MTAPCVLLFAREGRLPEEAELIAGLRARGGALEVIREQAALRQRLRERGGEPVILFVDLLSTLSHPAEIGGYEELLRSYAACRPLAPISLVVLLPPRGQGPEEFVGCGDLVTAYLSRPFSWGDVEPIVERLAAPEPAFDPGARERT